MPRLCVYCGSSTGGDPRLREAAHDLGIRIAGRGVGLVYGGGNVGLMGVVADAALSRGGEVIGVIPEDLVEREVGHEGLTQQHIVQTMHQRKQLMCDLSDGFIALPGGFGTLDELMEMLTWRLLGYHGKGCGVLDVGGYYQRLLGFLDHAKNQGFIRPAHRELLWVETDADTLLDRLLAVDAD